MPLISSLEVIDFNFCRKSVMSHAKSAKIAPLNIQPTIKSNHNPIIAASITENKPSEETHLQPRHCENIHSDPNKTIQIEMPSNPACAYPIASEAMLMKMLNPSAATVTITSNSAILFYHFEQTAQAQLLRVFANA